MERSKDKKSTKKSSQLCRRNKKNKEEFYEDKENLDPHPHKDANISGERKEGSYYEVSSSICSSASYQNIQGSLTEGKAICYFTIDPHLDSYSNFLNKKVYRSNGATIQANPVNLLAHSRRAFTSNAEQNKFSFKISKNTPAFLFNIKKENLPKKEKKIVLSIVKSHTKIPAVNKTFVVTERGLDTFQKKSHNTHYISIGRQQVNDKGVRPNDIMLFPTDPSISRSHFKIFHQEYFDKLKEYEQKRGLIKKAAEMVPGLSSQSLLKFLSPKKKVAIEDNGTIYGTYVRVKGYSFESNFFNFLMTLERELKILKSSSLEEDYQNDFSFAETLDIFSLREYNEKTSGKTSEKKSEKTLENIKIDTQISLFKNNSNISTGLAQSGNSFPSFFNKIYSKKNEFKKFKPEKIKEILKFNPLPESETFKENNFIVDDFLPAVFLNSSRTGFNIVKIGNAEEVLVALIEEYNSFPQEVFVPNLEVISYEKIFDCQKQDISSQVFKASISKADFYDTYQSLTTLSNYSILYLVETSGDPCGVMNRINDVLFFSSKTAQVGNRKSFSFNFNKGFIIGSHPQAVYSMNCEVDSFLFYNSKVSRWCLTDLTKFLNPEVYFSTEYFGLWMCISKDKKSENRYTPKIFYVKSEDEIKVSETVIKLKI